MLQKVCQCNNILIIFWGNKEEYNIKKYVGYFVAMTVLVESENQFSLEELCRTQYKLKYFAKPYCPSDRLEKHFRKRLNRFVLCRHVNNGNLILMLVVKVNDKVWYMYALRYPCFDRCDTWMNAVGDDVKNRNLPMT